MKNTIIRQESHNHAGFSMGYTLFLTGNTYGISVKNQRSGESSTIGDISTNKVLSEQLFDLVLGGFVTPITLKDVAEDFVAAH